MQAVFAVVLLSFCAGLAVPVPFQDRSNQRREERMIPVDELTAELTDIETRIEAVRKKVKEQSEGGHEGMTGKIGISPTSSTGKNDHPTEANTQPTVQHGKIRVVAVVEKITPPSASPSIQSTKTEITPTLSGAKLEPSVANTVTVQVKKMETEAIVNEEKDKEKKGSGEEMEKKISPERSTLHIAVEKLSTQKSETQENKEINTSVNETSSTKEKEQVVGSDGGDKEKDKEVLKAGVVVEKVENKNGEGKISFQVAKESNDEDLDLAAEGSRDSKGMPVVVSVEKISPEEKKVQGRTDGDVSKENANSMPKVRVEKITDSGVEEAKDKTSKQKQIIVEKVVNDERENEEEDLESEEKESHQKIKDSLTVKVEEHEERKPDSVQSSMKILANDKGEDEERDLQNDGTSQEGNGKIDIQEESRTETANPNTFEKPQESGIPKVTVEKVETVQKENEAENMKEFASNGKDNVPSIVEVRTVKSDASDYEELDLSRGEPEKLARVDGEEENHEKAVEMKETETKMTITKEKVESTPQREMTENKRSQIQEAQEEEDLEEEKLKENSLSASDKKVTMIVEKIQPSLGVSADEAKGATKPKAEDLVPTKENGEKMSSEEEDLMHNGEGNTEAQRLPKEVRRSEVILKDLRKAENHQDDEGESELEQQQGHEFQAKEKTPEEEKIALEFEKALEIERSKKQTASRIKVSKLTSPTNRTETLGTHESSTRQWLTTTESLNEPKRQRTKSENESEGRMTIEERELAELAENALNDDKNEIDPLATEKATPTFTEEATTVTEPTKPTEIKTSGRAETTAAATTAATKPEEKMLVVKVERLSKVVVSVSKEEDGKLLSKKETAPEERKKKEELTKELKQEASKDSKITQRPSIKPTSGKVQENPVVKPDERKTEVDLQQAQEDELEDEAEAK